MIIYLFSDILIKKNILTYTVNQLLFMTALFCDIPEMNWFASAFIYTIKM